VISLGTPNPSSASLLSPRLRVFTRECSLKIKKDTIPFSRKYISGLGFIAYGYPHTRKYGIYADPVSHDMLGEFKIVDYNKSM